MTDTSNRSTATTARRRQDDESAGSRKRSRTQAAFYRINRAWLLIALKLFIPKQAHKDEMAWEYLYRHK